MAIHMPVRPQVPGPTLNVHFTLSHTWARGGYASNTMGSMLICDAIFNTRFTHTVTDDQDRHRYGLTAVCRTGTHTSHYRTTLLCLSLG